MVPTFPTKPIQEKQVGDFYVLNTGDSIDNNGTTSALILRQLNSSSLSPVLKIENSGLGPDIEAGNGSFIVSKEGEVTFKNGTVLENLTVEGITTFNGVVSITEVNASSIDVDTLTVFDQLVTGNLSVSNNALVTGNLDVSNNFNVDGLSSFTSLSVPVSGTFVASGISTFYELVTIAAEITDSLILTASNTSEVSQVIQNLSINTSSGSVGLRFLANNHANSVSFIEFSRDIQGLILRNEIGQTTQNFKANTNSDFSTLFSNTGTGQHLLNITNGKVTINGSILNSDGTNFIVSGSGLQILDSSLTEVFLFNPVLSTLTLSSINSSIEPRLSFEGIGDLGYNKTSNYVFFRSFSSNPISLQSLGDNHRLLVLPSGGIRISDGVSAPFTDFSGGRLIVDTSVQIGGLTGPSLTGTTTELGSDKNIKIAASAVDAKLELAGNGSITQLNLKASSEIDVAIEVNSTLTPILNVRNTGLGIVTERVQGNLEVLPKSGAGGNITASGFVFTPQVEFNVKDQAFITVSGSRPNLYVKKKDVSGTPPHTLVYYDGQEDRPISFGYVPLGSIIAWHKNFAGTPTLPEDFLECNGQTVLDNASPYYGQALPDLNNPPASTPWASGGSFIRGGNISNDVPLHDQLQDHTHVTDTAYFAPIGGFGFSSGGNNINVTSGTGAVNSGGVIPGRKGVETYPIHVRMVWIMRIK